MRSQWCGLIAIERTRVAFRPCFSISPELGLLTLIDIIDIVSPLALFKNPMILMALVALGFTFGMPKLMENSMCCPESLDSTPLVPPSLSLHLIF